MFALISAEKVQLPPGAIVRLPATWQKYQVLFQQRGDGSITRMEISFLAKFNLSIRANSGRSLILVIKTGNPLELIGGFFTNCIIIV